MGGLGSRETGVKLDWCLNFMAEVGEGVMANAAVKKFTQLVEKGEAFWVVRSSDIAQRKTMQSL